MSKQPKRPTRKEKIAQGKTRREYKPAKVATGALQAQLLQAGLTDLTARVEALEAPAPAAAAVANPELVRLVRKSRDYFGKGDK